MCRLCDIEWLNDENAPKRAPAYVMCPSCHGVGGGVGRDGVVVDCSRCNGDGQIKARASSEQEGR